MTWVRWGVLAAGMSLAACAPRPNLPTAFNQRYRQTLRSLDLESVNVPYRAGELDDKPVLIALTATYCLPCVAQVAQLMTLHERFAARGLKVLAIGMDLEGAAVLGPFADVYQLPFPLLVADEDMRTGKSVFGRVSALPTTVVLNRDGTAAGAFVGLPRTQDVATVVEKTLK